MIKWLDVVDQKELQTLASSYQLQLTSSTLSFLESFAHLVNRASNTRRKLLSAAIARKTDVQTVNAVIADEVSHLQHLHPHAHIIPYRHPETSLPIVYVRLQAVPDLVIHIFRSYANTRRGLAFGFRAYSFCRGHLTGPLARAANYLRARCTANSWNVSLTELVGLWCAQVNAISLEQRHISVNPKMSAVTKISRRRRQKRTSPPPLVSDIPDHASLPQDHPKTNVVIKDDKLLPNRTFNDPEELYAEQVRAIRRKRKPVSDVLDDYELAWKKRRPEEYNRPSSEQSRSKPQPDVSPQAEAQPPTPTEAHRDSAQEPEHHLPPNFSKATSLFPFQNPTNKPSEAEIQQHTEPRRAGSLDEPGFSFHNPFSPEFTPSGNGEDGASLPSPPLQETQMEDAQSTEQAAATIEAAERAVSSQPAKDADTTASQPPIAVDSKGDADENAPPVFVFSSRMASHVSPATFSAGRGAEESVPGATHVPGQESVEIEAIEERTVTPAAKEELGEKLLRKTRGQAENTVKDTITLDKRSTKEMQNVSPGESHGQSGAKAYEKAEDPPSSVKPVESEQYPVDSGKSTFTAATEKVAVISPEVPKPTRSAEQIGKPSEKSAGEEEDRDVKPPTDICTTRSDAGHDGVSKEMSPSTLVNHKTHNHTAQQETDLEVMAPKHLRSPDKGGLESKLPSYHKSLHGLQRNRPTELHSEKMAPKSDITERTDDPKESDRPSATESKKRNREIHYSSDIIIVDTDSESDEENKIKRPKKRKLSSPPEQQRTSDESHREVEDDKTALQKERMDDEVDQLSKYESNEGPKKTALAGKERQVIQHGKDQSDKGTVHGETREKSAERPSPRNVSIWKPERANDVSSTQVRMKDTEETGDKGGITKRRRSDAREVSHDTGDRKRFSGYEVVTYPAGVDCDPCPMALSEPSESSKEFGDRTSNSDEGSISDGAAKH